MKIKAETKIKTDQEIQTIEVNLKKARNQLAEVQTVGQQAWSDYKRSIEKALDSLQKSLKEVGQILSS